MPEKKDNPKYVPKSLSEKDKSKQRKSIKEGTDRPKVDYDSKRSSHTVAYEKKYGRKITDLQFIYKNIISKEGVDQILAKGHAAYYSAGSRPNTTPYAWKYARLASVILGRAARKVDLNIWNKYKK